MPAADRPGRADAAGAVLDRSAPQSARPPETAGGSTDLPAGGDRGESAATPEAAGASVGTVETALPRARSAPRQAPQTPAHSQTVRFRVPPVAPPAVSPERSRPGRLGAFPVLRVVCWQLALVLVFVATGWPWPVVTVAALLAAGLVAVTAIGVRGRWLSESLGLRLRLGLRRRKCLLPEQDPAAALVRLLAPDARIHTAEVAGSAAGVVCRAEELTAVLRPLDCTSDAIARMALAGRLLPEDDPATPSVRLRLVLHRSPRRPGAPAQQPRAWLAVGVRRDSDFPDDADLSVSLSNAVGRVRRKLRGSGIDAAPLSDLELADTLTSLSHVGHGERSAVREQWRYWRAGPICQTSLRIRDLDAHPDAARIPFVYRLHAALAADVAVTVALTCAEEPDAVVRIASPNDAAVDTAARALSWTASTSGVRLIRLDGQHGPAVAASLPIGGNPR